MKYAKGIVAALGAILTVCTAAFADNSLSTDETGSIIATVVVQGITIAGVIAAKNKGYVYAPETQPADQLNADWKDGYNRP